MKNNYRKKKEDIELIVYRIYFYYREFEEPVQFQKYTAWVATNVDVSVGKKL